MLDRLKSEFIEDIQSGLENCDPKTVFETVTDLRAQMIAINPKGGEFLEYLLEGNYFDGKGVWVSAQSETKTLYEEIISLNPHLMSESPYGEHFNQASVRVRGENPVKICSIQDAPLIYQTKANEYAQSVKTGLAKPIAVFAGGPAAKIASILPLLHKEGAADSIEVRFLLDGAEQSNESGSASYEHINHANALNAEHDNTGLGILFLAMKRALFGEPDPNVAVQTGYHKVDIWPRGLRLRDVPIYIVNEIHGRMQWLKYILGIQNDHDKSRLASKLSTQVLTYIEKTTGTKLRLDNENLRAIFVYFTKKHHEHSLKDEDILTKTVGITPMKLTKAEVENFYGPKTSENIFSADIFFENSCIRHGFDEVCGGIIETLGGTYLKRTAVRRVFMDNPTGGRPDTVLGLEIEDLPTGECRYQPCTHLGLSLGPTATFEYETATSFIERLKDKMSIGLPVPYQTIATGFTAQLLFQITDHRKFYQLPFTGLKQTHFVEIGRSKNFIAIKLTSGGVIGQPVYSRSYGISAIANMLRILTPDSGLEFYDVICAWPCSRGVNGTNNGQVVRIANNAAARFGEGGTGMSKMGTNAQTLLDLIGVDTALPTEIKFRQELYRHTIVDSRKRVSKRIGRTDFLVSEENN